MPKNYEQDTSLFGKITLPLGHVFIQSIVDDNWEKARFNRDVFSNEKVKTETKSRCEIKLGEKKVLRIGEKTIVTLMYPEVNNVAMQIESGQAWLTDFSKKRSCCKKKVRNFFLNIFSLKKIKTITIHLKSFSMYFSEFCASGSASNTLSLL